MYCRRLACSQAGNFRYAMRLLPPAKRQALYTLYAWMRLADDIADQDGALTNTQRIESLENWHAWTRRAISGCVEVTPAPSIWPAVAEMVEPEEEERRGRAAERQPFERMEAARAPQRRDRPAPERRHVAGYASSSSGSPPSTACPATTWTLVTVPARSAWISFCIFIASSTTSGWPASTAAPSATATLTTRPGM